jgi:xanthine/CO dehydrogenase XdhC/CoxF family maturation factor
MSELDRILEAIREWADRGTDFALATVIGVRGSTYRGLAARQLIAADGSGAGTVSGGCLDQELHAVATRVIGSGVPEVVEFDLTADDEAMWGWGIGCNGATELLVEPSPSALSLADHIADIRVRQRPTVIVHSLAHPVGERAFVSKAHVEGEAPSDVVAAARGALTEGWHRIHETPEGRTLLEVVGAPSRLVVCGAGHDAVPIVRMGADLGFEVIVVDDRRQFLTEDRFPDASRLVHVRPADLTSLVEMDQRTYVLLMSHNYVRDLNYLRSLMGTDVAYVGSLGPGVRLGRMLDDLRSDGLVVEDHDLAKLHGPAGLDVGAEGPVEIAWSIIAEILAVRRHRPGGFLKDRKGPEILRS